MSEEQERVVIRDNRKIDRDAPAADPQAQTQSADPQSVDPQSVDPQSVDPQSVDPQSVDPAADPSTLIDEFDAEFAAEPQVPMVEAALLAERTADLQRLQAEYANYRKRAERDRLLAGDVATSRVLTELLPVVDDLDRAKAHGDLTGPLKAVADKLEGVTTKLGLVAFGAVGDPFDPSIHEAVLHDESDAVTVATCTTVMRPGYQHHDRLLRAAMVGVSEPATVPVRSEHQPSENEIRDGEPDRTQDEQPEV